MVQNPPAFDSTSHTANQSVAQRCSQSINQSTSIYITYSINKAIH